MNHAMLSREALRATAEAQRPAFEAALKTLVEIPSISSDPERKADIRRCAEAAADLVRSLGGSAEVLETTGQPMVVGEFPTDPSHPTLTIYNHLDVQPAQEPEWTTEPFALALEGDTYKGRGTTDDKGPLLAGLFGALAAREAGVPMNVKLLWECEEEVGSPSFRAALETYKDRLATDSILVSDTVWTAAGRPSTPAGLRGILTFFLRLETGHHDCHSGVVGGAARNPLGELMEVYCSLVNPRTGKVKVPHFYDEVEKPTKQELADWAAAGFTTEDFKADNGLIRLRTEDPLKIMKRIWAKPTLEVHGLQGGHTGPGTKAAVPPRGELKCSCRLVPGMDGKKTMERIRKFVNAQFPDVDVVDGHYGPAFKGHTEGPLADAIKEAYAFAFGQPCSFTRQGGTIGAMKALEDVLEAPVYFLGLSLPSHGYHAPNENFDWTQAEGGMAAFAHYLSRAAQVR